MIVQPGVLALSVLMERIESIPLDDQNDMFDLLQEYRTADKENKESILVAMREVLEQRPIKVKPFFDIGINIKDLRKKNRLTQAQLADLAGLPQSHISRLENERHVATVETMRKIAAALKVPMEDIKQR